MLALCGGGDALFNACIRSIRARSPSSVITLLTDERSCFGADDPAIERIREPGIRTEYAMYERARLYGEHARRRQKQGSTKGIVFMDMDIIINRDLSSIFVERFDIGLTYHHDPNVVLDRRGIPLNTQTSPINGGVIFCKPTHPAVKFFSEQMKMYDRLHAEGGFVNLLAKDIRRWGGDQFAFMAMVGKDALAGKAHINRAGALVRFFDSERYNYSPPLHQPMTRAQLEDKFIIHMKGQRKVNMPQLAFFLGIPLSDELNKTG